MSSSKNHFCREFSLDDSEPTSGKCIEKAFCNGVAESGGDGIEGKSFFVSVYDGVICGGVMFDL